MITALNYDLLTVILVAVFLICVIGLFLIGIWFLKNKSQSRKQNRLNQFVAPNENDIEIASATDSSQQAKKDLGKFRDWINNTLSSLTSDKLMLKLSSAYWPITDTEYILIRVFGTILAFLLGWLLLRNFLGGLFLAVIAIMVPPIILDRAIAQRQQKFQSQLLDVLILIKGAVQAGYSLMQALDLAVQEIPPPASEEFGRILREVRLGFSMEDALFNLAERMESDDLQIVVTAIIINSQVGGSLSRVLESTISTIRDRIHLFAEIRSLTSYARYVGNFLTLMPFLMGLAIFLISPDYFDTVKTSLFTQIIFLVALLGVILGNIWIRQIVKIKV